jgi:hypothetical protein
MTYDLFVEISDTLDAGLQERLLAAAYRASRTRRVGLVLRGLSREQIDRRLDPIVEREGTGFRGVRYLEVEDVRALLSGNGAGSLLVLSTVPDWVPDFSGERAEIWGPEAGLALLAAEDARATARPA